MKRFLAIALAATVGLALAGTAQAVEDASLTAGGINAGTFANNTNANAGQVALYPVGMTANGIQASRHNLGSMGTWITVSPETGGASTSEVCVFCHTPHHSISTTSATTKSDKTGIDPINTTTVTGIATNSTGNYGPAPLWNRRSSASSFTAYGTTLGGTANTTIGGVTLACLSCHDGITTFDNLVNYPGAGLSYTNSSYGGAKSRGYAAADEGGENGVRSFGQYGAEARVNIGNMGATISASSTSSTNADLSNDHPMSIDYNQGQLNLPGIVASLRQSDTRIDSIDLRTGLMTTIQELSDNLAQNRWAVKGFISTTATINDLLRNGKVECSSCHDPHFKNLSNVDIDLTTLSNNENPDGSDTDAAVVAAGGVGVQRRKGGAVDQQDVASSSATGFKTSGMIRKADGLFLRRVGGNAGSGVCRTCHNK